MHRQKMVGCEARLIVSDHDHISQEVLRESPQVGKVAERKRGMAEIPTGSLPIQMIIKNALFALPVARKITEPVRVKKVR